MKKILLSTLFIFSLSCKAQEYPLTEIDLPENSYRKDFNNQLLAFEGTWKGTWNNKTLTIKFKKVIHEYDNVFKTYNDRLIGKFQVKDTNGNILFDNLNVSDNESKIKGIKIFSNGKYVLTYVDADLCLKSGGININFTNAEKTQLQLMFFETSNLTEPDCFYHGKPADQRPEPLPKDIILTKE